MRPMCSATCQQAPKHQVDCHTLAAMKADDPNHAERSILLADQFSDWFHADTVAKALHTALAAVPRELRGGRVPLFIYESADASTATADNLRTIFAALLQSMGARCAICHEARTAGEDIIPAELVYVELPRGFVSAFQVLPSPVVSAVTFASRVSPLIQNRRALVGRVRVMALRVGEARGMSLVLVTTDKPSQILVPQAKLPKDFVLTAAVWPFSARVRTL